jgi:hypothetical protein
MAYGLLWLSLLKMYMREWKAKRSSSLTLSK